MKSVYIVTRLETRTSLGSYCFSVPGMENSIIKLLHNYSNHNSPAQKLTSIIFPHSQEYGFHHPFNSCNIFGALFCKDSFI